MAKPLLTAATLFALMATPIAPGANAQAVIIGGGLAKDCYLAVEAGATNFVQTERLCTRALEGETMTRGNRAATYVNRGILRMRNDRIDGAIDDYDRALQLDDELGAAWLNRGAALILDDQIAEALVALDKAISFETQDLHAAHYNRALAREKSGDVTGAYYDFRDAAALKPDWDLPQYQLQRFTVVGEG